MAFGLLARFARPTVCYAEKLTFFYNHRWHEVLRSVRKVSRMGSFDEALL